MIRCPKCNYFKVATERRPDGNSKCIACQYEAPTKEFDVRNWDWIDQETQKQLDKLKSLMSVQLDMLEQNKQMSAEIEQLKKENAELKDKLTEYESGNLPTWRSEYDLIKSVSDSVDADNQQLKSKLKVAAEALRLAPRYDEDGLERHSFIKAQEALKEIGE